VGPIFTAEEAVEEEGVEEELDGEGEEEELVFVVLLVLELAAEEAAELVLLELVVEVVEVIPVTVTTTPDAVAVPLFLINIFTGLGVDGINCEFSDTASKITFPVSLKGTVIVVAS